MASIYEITEAKKKWGGVPMRAISRWRGIPYPKGEEEEVLEPETNSQGRAEEGVPLPPAAAAGPAAPAFPARRQSGLAAALQGAAYSIQASAGPTAPGQEWKKGLLGGIVGVGMSEAAAARAQQLRDQNAAMLQDKQDARAAKLAAIRTPEEKAAEAGLIAEATAKAKLPTELEKMRENSKLNQKRIDAARNASIAGAKNENERKGYEWAWDQVRKLEKAGNIGDDDKEQTQMAEVYFARWMGAKGGSDDFKDLERPQVND